MNKQNNKNSFYSPVNWFQSLKHAIEGLILIFRNERNFKIQLFLGLCVIIAGIILGLSRQDWISILILIGFVFVAESLNSVVEAICDTVSQEYRVNIKYAKDVAAGAVLISSLISIGVGFLIVWPYVLTFIRRFI